MPSEILARLKQDTIVAMKAKDKPRLSVLRQLQAAVKQVEIDGRSELDDDGVLKVLQAYAKKVRDTRESAVKAGREETVADADAELALVQGYLPTALSDDELGALVDEAIAAAGASGPRDMGAVMKLVMPQVGARAEGSRVSAMVKTRLVG